MGRVAIFLCGGLAAGALAGLAGLGVVESGAFDARASTPHDPVTAWATHTTMIHSVHNGAASVHAPASFTATQVEAGFADYDADCVTCHGAPAIARAPWAKGLNPSPPFLLDAARQWTPAELYWIVRDGVKMTAMPAWSVTRSDDEIWDEVAFLEALPYLSALDYARMRQAAAFSSAFRQPGAR